GLPPELPGMQGADLTQRQTWWLMTVISTAAGLASIAFADKYYKILGVGLLLIPHVVGAPRHTATVFSHPDAAVVASLQSLHGQFIQLAALVNLSYWLVLGLLCAYVVKKYIKSPGRLDKDSAYKVTE
ncbi:MAG: CbtA family protein, partial [Thiohalomonadales bacterium]